MGDKKDQILQAALELFAAQGLGVSTAQIARAAGVANGTLFNYFPTKQELIDALYVQIKGEVGELFLGAGSQRETRGIFYTVWRSYVRWAIGNPLKQKVVHLLKDAGMVSPAVLARMEEAISPLGAILVEGMSEGTLRPLDPSYFRALLEAMITVCIDQAVERELEGEALNDHIETGFDILWKALT